MTSLASDRLSRIRALQTELNHLLRSGHDDEQALALSLRFIQLQHQHITELTDELGELRDALGLATLPREWCYRA